MATPWIGLLAVDELIVAPPLGISRRKNDRNGTNLNRKEDHGMKENAGWKNNESSVCFVVLFVYDGEIFKETTQRDSCEWRL